MNLHVCPGCGADEEEGFNCYVAFIRGQYAYLFYCDQCQFNHLIARVA